VIRHVFAAMGTDVEVLLAAPDSPEARAELWAAESEFRRLEELLTRFDPESELCRLNRTKALLASEELLDVTELALEARARTRGRFDPTVHDALVFAGYDRTFSELREDSDAGPVIAPPRCGGAVTVDRAAGTVSLAPDTSLDFGGIAKGYAVDRACALLGLSAPCLVNAGGDLAVHGLLEDGPWPVAVETADGSITLGLERGALATTGRDRRHWVRAGRTRHHIIDPRTSLPAEGDLLRITVVASTACEAEVLAKALFLAGEERAALEAAELEVPCVLVTMDGRTVVAGGLA
jgi:thiamine biosynthesis lipoprotein